MAGRGKSIISAVAFGVVAACFVSSGQTVHPQGETPVRAALAKWKLNDYAPSGYVPDAECGGCHKSEFSNQTTTPMAHALHSAETSRILSTHPQLRFQEANYTYDITRHGNASIYSVSDGVNTLSEPILFAFGDGVAGQTYLISHRGALYEARLSYYQFIQKLDITTGHPRRPPLALDDALGRPIGADETRDCFSCHSTDGSQQTKPQPGDVIPGVSCQRCHGPGRQHIAAVKAGAIKDPEIFNPASLSSDDLSQEFCGNCHRSFDQVMEMPGQGGLMNVRFQPYRIANSKGHNTNEPRIGCIACHDPHDALRHDPSFYDSKCFACHFAGANDTRNPAGLEKPCPVAKQQCVTCHMPRVEVPEMHFKFTDHWIRVVRRADLVPR